MTSPRRALIVIDVQNEYVSGDLPIEYPEVQSSLANIGRAMDAARAAGVPVVVVQNFAPGGSPIFARGSDGAELHPVVASREQLDARRGDYPLVVIEFTVGRRDRRLADGGDRHRRLDGDRAGRRRGGPRTRGGPVGE